MLKAAFTAEGCKGSAMWLANEAFKWVEFFSGSGMASKCMTHSGELGCALDILHYEPKAISPDKQNYLDMLTPSGMAKLSCNSDYIF